MLVYRERTKRKCEKEIEQEREAKERGVKKRKEVRKYT